MKRETYQRGLPGVKWGIWNCRRKCFQFSISEDTPMLAEARLYQKIGDDARKWRLSLGSCLANMQNLQLFCQIRKVPF